MSKKHQTTELTQTSNENVIAVQQLMWTTKCFVERVRVQRPINGRAKKKNKRVHRHILAPRFLASCASRRGSDGNVQPVQPRRPTPWKTKLQIPTSAVVAETVSRMCPTRRAVSRATPMNRSPRSRAHLPRSRQPRSLACKNLLLGMQSFADERTVESRSDSTCDCRCPVVGLHWPQVPINVVFRNFKQCICHVRLTQ